MGAYLSEPITKKISSDESGTSVACGASSMQGWRVSQEDAHNCCIDFDENTSLFAVYDGHGGHEVATYCAKELPRFIKNTETYKAGNIRQALIDAFLGFDATLTKPNIIALLKEIAGSNENDKAKAGYCDSDLSSEESVSDLRKEAAMPLEQVIARYQRPELEFESKDIKEDITDGGVGQSSPYLRCRRTRDKSGGSTSGHCSTDPGCSSSSSSWKVSQDTDEKAAADARPASPNRDKNIDTGTSNGSVDRAAEPPAEAQTTKSTADIPDSSEDVKEQQTQSTDSNAAPAGNADSSKTSRDDVSSSSSADPVENGQGETVYRRKMLNLYYQSLSRKRSCNSRRKHYLSNLPSSKLDDDEDDDDDDDQDDDDDDEENDETFDGQHASSDDDLHKMDGNDEDTNSSSSSSTNGDNANLKDENDEDDDDDDDEDDDDDDDEGDENDDDSLGLDFSMNMPEEPGSDSGCTAVVAILHARDLYVANAGDSRCVLCRDGQALELSLDHKPEDEPEMERIIKAGGKVTGDGRVNGGLNLSRALGDHAYKQNTALPADEQMISALPDVRHIAIEPGRDEFMILACDGIWNFMSSQEVVSFIRPRLANLKESNISSICEELFDHCLAPDTHGDGTGCDNMTAVIVKFIWKDDAANDGSNPVCKVISGQANATKKRPISPDNNSEVAPAAAAAAAASNNDREASDNGAEKHNPADCTTSTSSNDSAVKDSCKRLKSEIV